MKHCLRFRAHFLNSAWVAAVCLLHLVLLWPPGGSHLVAFAQNLPGAGSGTFEVLSREQRTRREQWFLHGRTVPGEPTAALRYRAHLQKMRMRAARLAQSQDTRLAATQSLSGNAWTALGPAPLASDASGAGQGDYNWVSGRATAVAVDLADPTANTVYVGGAYGGVWKSVDAGPLSPNPANVTWQAVIDNQPTLAVGAIAIQPGNSDPAKSLVLVGTGEANSSADSYYGLGILRSPDAGKTWTLISSDSTGTRPFAGMAFSKIAFSAAAPSLAVAATAGASEGILEGLEDPVTANLGLYYSTDNGADWTYATVQDGATAIDPGSATSVVYNAGAGEFLAAFRYHGFYSSSDGINWTRLTNQPGAGLSTSNCPPNPHSTSCPIYRGEIAVVPGRNEMYAWYVDAYDNDQGIWASSNGGSSWTQLDGAGITNCGDQFGCGTEQGTYDLVLAAVPNGSATDLYAGAINLYKCTITSVVPDCSGTGSNTFLNLTHVYGCPPDFGSIAHVHPAQHALSFLLINSNTQDVMFFANDGGIYRALDGYTGLTTGTCGGSNSFDSLNQTLGSMTQFVSFSESASDPNIVLGGTQGNGAAATALALINSSWQAVNAGDNGHTEISPDNEAEWFVSNPPDSLPGVNIFSYASGINCHTQDFQNHEVVSSATVGGDTGAFYPSYILDPQNSGELIVGTCRMWRGPSTGGAFTVLSHSFDTGGDGICTGGEINLVRSVAAGGARDNNGFSNVIYAGTNGFGPLIPTSPTGGHVWVSTNAAGGPSTWVDRTGAINPNNFPISSIALDSSDKSGLTAYVTIMGFHVSHVWKTSDGGGSWTDFTANLPDAPANAILVDPGPNPNTGTVYVGTDVGVFSSSTAAASWTEVGPAPNSGQPGYLPNVAVTALRMFNNGTSKLLRASTYGRGVWQFPLIVVPDFVVTVSNNNLTVFGGQSAQFNGQVIALNGYSSQVNLSCTAGNTAPPPTCTPVPPNLIPTSSGTPFTLTASGPDGDYLFNVHAVGTDQNQTTHDYPLTLHVVDFGLTPPSPASVSVNEPSDSPPIKFQVTAAGSFSGVVSLSCIGLPNAATCNFQPSDSVSPAAGKPVNITLTIVTTTSTPTGTFPITIQGSTPGGPNQTQSLSLTVTNYADYNLQLTSSSQNAIMSQTPSGGVLGSATFHGTLIAQNGYSSAVNLSCGAGAPPICTPVPASATPGTSGTPFLVSVKSNVVQSYSFDIVAVGTDPSSVTHKFPVRFSTTFNFQISNLSGTQSIPAGQSAIYDLDVLPLGSNFPNPVTLSCSGLPGLSTCSFSPGAQIGQGSGEQHPTLTIQTTAAPVLASLRPVEMRQFPLYALSLLVPGLLLFAGPGSLRSRRKHLTILLSLAPAVLLLGMVACGGGGGSSSSGSGQPGTTPGTYTITVTAKSGTLIRATPVVLTVN